MKVNNTDILKNATDHIIYVRSPGNSGTSAMKDMGAQVKSCRDGLNRRGVKDSNFYMIMEHTEAPGQPVLNAILKAAVKKRIKVLAIADLAGLGHGLSIDRIVGKLVENGRVIAMAENLDTVGNEQILSGQLAMAFATSSKLMSLRVHDGQRRKALAAAPLGPTIFGYRTVNKSGRMTLVIIQALFEHVAQALSDAPKAGLITGWVKGLVPDIVTKLTKNGKASASARRILTNAKYMGHWAWGKTVTIRSVDGRRRQHRANLGDVVHVKRPNLAIVAEDLFARVRAVTAGWSKRAA